jgi:hypothetical protein
MCTPEVYILIRLILLSKLWTQIEILNLTATQARRTVHRLLYFSHSKVQQPPNHHRVHTVSNMWVKVLPSAALDLLQCSYALY